MKIAGRLCLFVCLAALAWTLALSGEGKARGARPQQFQPGFRTIGIWNPATQTRMDVAVWYPSLRPPKDLRIDGWSISVAKNGREIPGQYPVILISHGSGGSRLSVHDLAAALARQAFIVIAPTHPGDNAEDVSEMYRARLFMERPRNLLQALEAVLGSPELAPLADESRIGLLGVGSGAATVLQLAGAAPDLSLLPAYCPPENSSDFLCTNWALAHHAAMMSDYTSILNAWGPAAFTPELDVLAAPEEPAEEHANGEAAAGSDEDEETKMTSPIPAPVRIHPGPAVARRPAARRSIKALGLMTPGLIGLFPEAALRGVTTPAAVLDAANDEIYPAQENEKRLLRFLPTRPSVLTLKKIGHYAAQAPCPPAHAENVPALCGGRGQRDSEARAQRNSFLITFFQQTLGGPLPPAPPPAETPKRARPPRPATAAETAKAVAIPAKAVMPTKKAGVALRQDNATRPANGTAPAGRTAPGRSRGAR